MSLLTWQPIVDAGHWSPDRPLGLAVSGGSDSLALLHQTKIQFPHATLYCVTVDHGLRPEAQAEAALVADHCHQLGIPHHTVTLEHLHNGSNLLARARAARYDALVQWAQDLNLGHVALGHTKDDVAETFLMRLSRGSGLAGLASMPVRTRRGTVDFIRPLLAVSRADLQTYLSDKGIDWIDDPTNSDPTFLRTKIRNILPQLEDIGLTADRIAEASRHLRDAHIAVVDQVTALYHNAVRFDGPDVLVDRLKFEQAPKDVRMRMMAGLAKWMGNSDYPPRYASLIKALTARKPQTLHGIIWSGTDQTLRMTREPQGTVPSDGPDWDGRWAFAQVQPGQHLRALGEDGVRQLPDWRAVGLPRVTLLSAPSVWKHDTLIAAPHAGFGPDSAMTCKPPDWMGRFSR